MANSKDAALKEIAEIAFAEMEGCDQPYFTAFSSICGIATNPDGFYEVMEEARFLILERRDGEGA